MRQFGRDIRRPMGRRCQGVGPGAELRLQGLCSRGADVRPDWQSAEADA